MQDYSIRRLSMSAACVVGLTSLGWASGCSSEVVTFGAPGAGGGTGGATSEVSTSTAMSTVSTTGPGGEGGTSAGGNSAGGAPADCTSDEQCEVDSPCIDGTCENGTCVLNNTPKGESCGADQVCDGNGACVKGKVDGESCGSGSECASGNCVDGVCCNSLCDGLCEACDIANSEGTCSPLGAGEADAMCMGGVCDGAQACVSGDHESSSSLGATGRERILDVAVDSGDNVYVVGYYTGAPNFGGGSLNDFGTYAAFIAKFDSSGAHIWSKGFGGPSDGSNQTFTRVESIAVAANDDIVVAGNFDNSIDFGGGALTTAGNQDVFLARLDKDGNHQWSKRFGDAGVQDARSVAIGPKGNIVLGGHFQSGIDFGFGFLLSSGSWDAFAAYFDGTGAAKWGQKFGDAQDQRIYGVGIDAKGDLVLTGRFFGSINFGGGGIASKGDRDAFLAKLSATGSHVWSKGLGGSNDQLAWDLALNPAGDIAVVGFAEGSVDFGGGTLNSAGQEDAFVALFNSSGTHQWSKLFGDDDEQFAYGVAFDSKGRIVVAGSADSSVDFGGGPLMAASGPYDATFAKFTSKGEHLYSKIFGSGSADTATAVAVNSKDAAVVVGWHYSEVDFGGGALGSTGDSDGFVATFSE